MDRGREWRELTGDGEQSPHKEEEVSFITRGDTNNISSGSVVLLSPQLVLHIPDHFHF